MWAELPLLLIACEPPSPPPSSPASTTIAAEPLLPATPLVITVTRDETALSIDGRRCPGPQRRWQQGDVSILCIDPATLRYEEAAALLAADSAPMTLALYPAEALRWPLWFLGAEVTLQPADAPLRDEAGGLLRLGVQDQVTLARSADGWSHIGGGWLRDDRPLGDLALLLPRAPAGRRTFALPAPEIVHTLALEIGGGDGGGGDDTVTMNGEVLPLGPAIHTAGGYTLYNPPRAALRRGENVLESGSPVGLSAHIGAEVVPQWRQGPAAAGWRELRFDEAGWRDGAGGRRRRAVLTDIEGGLQVGLGGPGQIWLNGVSVLALEAAGRGQVPPSLLMAGDNLLAVEADEGVAVSVWRY